MNEQLDLSKYQDKKLIAFDLYGTFIDHHSKMIRIPREFKDILTTNPITIEEAKEKFGERYKISDELIENVRRDIEGTFLFPETLETLKYIKSKGYKIAVVSNLGKDYEEPLHRLIPEGIFDYEVLSFDVRARKPDPKIYEYLKSLSGVDFKDIIMIGDSLKADVLGPNSVGITPIYLKRKRTEEEGTEEEGTEEEGIKEVEKLGIKVIQISTLADLMKIL